MRHWELLTIGRSNSQRLLPHHLLPNHLSIHTLYIPRTHPAVKPPQTRETGSTMPQRTWGVGCEATIGHSTR
jgi:hypothetical protein